MPPENHMTGETSQRVNELVIHLHRNVSTDNMTKTKTKWLLQTGNPPRILFFMPSQRSTNHIGSEGQLFRSTERLSNVVDKLLQPILQRQKSYLKDIIDFKFFLEKTKVSQDTILVSMDVTKGGHYDSVQSTQYI